jgi:hypothetical protein
MGITFEGKGLERYLADKIEFLEESSGSGIKASLGDLLSSHPKMQGAFVEAKNNAWNQVRPWKYLVHVGHCNGDYYVVPPHVLVQKARERKGQHTYNPFECVGLGKPSHTNWFGDYRVAEKDLGDAIIDAYESSHSPHNIKYRDFAIKTRVRLEALVETLKKEGSRL